MSFKGFARFVVAYTFFVVEDFSKDVKIANVKMHLSCFTNQYFRRKVDIILV